MITCNQLNYGRCPHCDVLLNSLSWIPLEALASRDYQEAKCPMCKKALDVRARLTIDIEIEKGEE